MAGYNIECDPGDLYSRKCYVVTGAGVRQEIIGYDSAGNPISKQATTAAGTAWQPSITVLDQDGNPYQPYGSMPGAGAAHAYQERTCNPLWPTFGCKTGNINPTGVTTAPDDETSAGTMAWLKEYFGFWNAEEKYESQSTDNKIIQWWNSLIGS